MKLIHTFLKILVCMVAFSSQLLFSQENKFSNAVNKLGVEFLQEDNKGEMQNTVFSPYSLQLALAMTYAGATGKTRREMRRVLHYPSKNDALWNSIRIIQNEFVSVPANISKKADFPDGHEPPTLNVANRIFLHRDFEVKPTYLSQLENDFQAGISLLDFRENPDLAADTINKWVSENTHGKINQVINSSQIQPVTRLVLANAVYFKGSWHTAFMKKNTSDQLFWVNGKTKIDVPTMKQTYHFGYQSFPGGKAISLPYTGDSIQFLILLPNKKNGLLKLKQNLNPGLLKSFRKLPDNREIQLFLPKFELKTNGMAIKNSLMNLGMHRAFDEPPGSAEFEGIAAIKSNDYLCISDIAQSAFIKVDEEGTEAAAGTIITMIGFGAGKERPPKVVKVDRPFIFAIQDVESGVCLFLGQVVDPR